MADFYPPQFAPPPDVLGSYLRGQMAPLQQAQAQQDYQLGQYKLQEAPLQIEQLRQMLQQHGLLNQYISSRLGGAQAAPTDQGGVQTGPQQKVTAPTQASGSYNGSNYSSPFGTAPLDPELEGAIAMLQGRDDVAAREGAVKYNQTQAQLQARGTLNMIDTMYNSADPARTIALNPSLQPYWVSYAKQHNMVLNNDNARQALAAYGNALRGQVGMDDKEYPLPVEQNGLQTLDPITHKVLNTQETANVVGPDGKPTIVTKNQSLGMEPFNPSIFGAANASDAAIDAAAEYVRTHGGQMPTGFSRNPIMTARVWDRVAQKNSESGDTMGAITARGAALKANSQALDQVTKLESATTSYYNTLDKNLTALQDLSGKVDTSGSPLINKVYRAWQQGVTGDPDVAKYVTYLRSAESEFAKIQSGSLGNAPASDSARKEAQDVINKFMSQGQINAVADAMRGEGNNRLTSIRQQKDFLSGQIGTAAPSAAAPGGGPAASVPTASGKSLPTGDKLNAYAAAHFGGDVQKATAFLKSKGYQ